MNDEFDFDLEYAFDPSVLLDDPLGYSAVNLRNPLNSIEAFCQILLLPEYKNNKDYIDESLDQIPRIVRRFVSMQAEVEKLAQVRTQMQNEIERRSFDIEKVEKIPATITVEEVLADLARYFHFSTIALRSHAKNLSHKEAVTQTAELMKELVVSMKNVLGKIKDYLKERSEKNT